MHTFSFHRITADNVAAKFAPSSGDQLVVSSRDIRDQHAANELESKCRSTIPSDSDVQFHFNLTECEPMVTYAPDKFDGVSRGDKVSITIYFNIAVLTN